MVSPVKRIELIRALVKDQNKQLKQAGSLGRVDMGADIKFLDPERIRTGILGLDIISNGGIPRGGMAQFWGIKSSGKTASTLRAVRTAQENEHAAVAWAAAEGFNKSWARKLGVLIPYSPQELEAIAEEEGNKVADALEAEQEDWPPFVLIQHAHGDGLLEMVIQHLRSNLFDLLVTDSLGAIKSFSNTEDRSLEDRQYGGESVLLGNFVGKAWSCFNTRYDPETLQPTSEAGGVPNRTALLCINQARVDMTPKKTPGTIYKYAGGESLKHAFHLSVQLSPGKTHYVNHKGKKLYYMQEMRARCDKSKVGPPRREAEWDFYIENYEDWCPGDIDTVKELFTWGTYYGVIEQKGSNYYIEGTKVKGKDKAIEMLRNEVEVYDTLYDRCLEEARKM